MLKRGLNAIVGTLSVGSLVGLLLLFLGDEFLSEDVRRMAVFNWLAFACGLAGFGLTLAFILVCPKVVPAGKRGLWLVVLLLANIFAVPFFWLWYVRPSLLGSPAKT